MGNHHRQHMSYFGAASQWWRYFQLGAKLHLLEILFAYLSPLMFVYPGSSGDALEQLFLSNLSWQLGLFLIVVQIPLLISGKMLYVDIGWPCGLVILGSHAFYGDGYWLRRYLVGGCFMLHGLRMAVGSILLFGAQSGFTYRFTQDLPRYQYAKVKWLKVGMPESGWWIKAQQDTLQQCCGNVILAPLVFLAAVNPAPELRALELVGLGVWVCAWVFENVADGQMQLFLFNCKKMAKLHPERKEKIRLSVLGHGEYSTNEYCLWRLCRHPNYFGEWLCWVGFSMAGASSLMDLAAAGLPAWRILGIGLMFPLILRFFYDCLVHWTGSGPAEHFSYLKRPSFGEYQKETRCFFPFELPFVDHFREVGFPDNQPKKSK